MIKGIIFDFGGVLKNDTDPFIFRDLAQAFGRKQSTVRRAAKKMIPQLHAGKITGRDFLKKMARQFKVEFKAKTMNDLLVRSYLKKGRLNKPMAGLVEKLGRHYELLLLTNTFQEHAGLNQKKGWYDFFPKKILSHRLGLVKPDKRVYLLAVKKLGFKAEECLFIDDKAKNLKPARELGLKTLRYRDVKGLKKDLRRLGVKIG